MSNQFSAKTMPEDQQKLVLASESENERQLYWY
jgi:hypothetical protein